MHGIFKYFVATVFVIALGVGSYIFWPMIYTPVPANGECLPVNSSSGKLVPLQLEGNDAYGMEPVMDSSNAQPSIEETINAVTDLQLHRYNAATLELIEQSLKRWSRQLSTPSRPVTPYFIQVSFRDLEHPEQRKFFNRVPTSFSLTDEQVDRLIAAGRLLLRNNPDFRQFLADLDGGRTERLTR